jgi:DNA-binding NarL/FixJ family response regulator
MENARKIRVLVLDDNPVLVDGLSFVINSTRQLTALVMAQRDQNLNDAVKRLAPDVIVAEPRFLERLLRNSDMTLLHLQSKARIIAYCDTRDAQPSEIYIAKGYCAILTKTVASARLLGAIKSVNAGDVIIDAALPPQYETPVLKMGFEPNRLSSKEELVLRHVALGKAMKEIAADIQLSAKTVETYKYRAIKKLDLRTRSDIVTYAISVGWLQH